MKLPVRMLGGTVAAIGVYWAVFELPYHVESFSVSLSPAYRYGSNNQVAAASLIAGTVVIAFMARFLGISRIIANFQNPPRVARRERTTVALLLVIFWIAIYLAVSLFFFVKTYPQLSDAAFFIKRLEAMVYGYRKPWTDFEYPYGALLIYPPVLPFLLFPSFKAAIDIRIAYIIYYELLQVSGLLLLYWILRALPFGRNRMTFLMAVLPAITIPCAIEINASLVRYIAPYGCILLIGGLDRTGRVGRKRAFLISLFGSAVLLSISPEIGIASSVALLCYWMMRARVGGAGALWGTIGVAAGAAAVIGGLGPAFMLSVRTQGSGGNNFPIIAAPQTLAYVAIVAVGLSAYLWRFRRAADAWEACFLSLSILSLLLVPGALGRCDPAHIFLYGYGAFLMGMLALAGDPSAGFYLLSTTIVGLFGVSLAAVCMHDCLPAASSYAIQSRLPPAASDLAKLSKYRSIGAPLPPVWSQADACVETCLRRTGRFHYEYFVDVVDVNKPDLLSRKLADLGRMRVIIAPYEPSGIVRERHNLRDEYRLARLSFLFGRPVTLSVKHATADPREEVLKYVLANFEKVDDLSFGEIWRRKERN